MIHIYIYRYNCIYIYILLHKHLQSYYMLYIIWSHIPRMGRVAVTRFELPVSWATSIHISFLMWTWVMRCHESQPKATLHVPDISLEVMI